MPGTLRATSAREENFLLVLRFVWLGSELRALPLQFTPKHRAQRMLETIEAPGPRGGGKSRLSCSTPPPRPQTHTKLPPVNDDLPRNLPKNDLRRFSLVQHTRTHVFANDRIGSSPFPLPYLSPEEHLVPRNSTWRGSVQKGKKSCHLRPEYDRFEICSSAVNRRRPRNRSHSGRRLKPCGHSDASSGEVPQGIGRPGTSFWSWRFRRETMTASRNLSQDIVTTERLFKATAKTRAGRMTTAYVRTSKKVS